MKFILFFYLLSLSVITGFALVEDLIVDSEFYQHYLENNQSEIQQESFELNNIPKKILESFADGSIDKKTTVHSQSLSQSHFFIPTPVLTANEQADRPYVLIAKDNTSNVRHTRSEEISNIN